MDERRSSCALAQSARTIRTREGRRSQNALTDGAIEFVDKMHEKYGCGAKEQFAICVAVDERPIGGLGILIVKKSMDAVGYECKGGKNVLTIKKSI